MFSHRIFQIKGKLFIVLTVYYLFTLLQWVFFSCFCSHKPNISVLLVVGNRVAQTVKKSQVTFFYQTWLNKSRQCLFFPSSTAGRFLLFLQGRGVRRCPAHDTPTPQQGNRLYCALLLCGKLVLQFLSNNKVYVWLHCTVAPLLCFWHPPCWYHGNHGCNHINQD